MGDVFLPIHRLIHHERRALLMFQHRDVILQFTNLFPSSCALHCFYFLHLVVCSIKESSEERSREMENRVACKRTSSGRNIILMPFRKMERTKGTNYYRCKSTTFIIKTITFVRKSPPAVGNHICHACQSLINWLNRRLPPLFQCICLSLNR